MEGLPLELSNGWLQSGAPLSLTALAINLVVGALLALVLRWHFERFGTTLSNRSEFAQVFPLIVLTTVLIITVVKSSLALSLGLVGALSIVRFRTPIKEPEELAYLFLAIAVGLGLGADQLYATVLSASLILSVVAVLRWARSGRDHTNLYLSLDWRPDASVEAPESSALDAISAVVGRHVASADLRRADARGQEVELTFYLELENGAALSGLIDDLQRSFEGIGVTFVDQNQLPSV